MKGQQVPIGSLLTISGTSTDDPTDNCQVSVLLNGIKPYQKTIPTGQSNSEAERTSDYSTWKYTFTPSYAVIKEGVNKITSKISCSPVNSPTSLSKWYSVNVTGVANTKMQQLVHPSLPSTPIPTATIAPPLQEYNTDLNRQKISTTTSQKATTGATSTTNTAPTAIPSIPFNTVFNSNTLISSPHHQQITIIIVSKITEVTHRNRYKI